MATFFYSMEERGQNTNERATLSHSVHHVALLKYRSISVYLFDLIDNTRLNSKLRILSHHVG